ncbi:MAG: DUF885 family protein [Candidatus Pacearchaeota archaeon]|nr:DUF885 family protein [Candidatus Pacearchaeota archaeon]
MKIENEIVELYKEIYPVYAFMQGISECRGKIFIPSKTNRKKVIRKINLLLKQARDKKHLIILKSLKYKLELYKPYQFVNGLGSYLFNYEMKKTSVSEILPDLKEGVRILIKEDTKMPIGIRILCAMGIDNAIVGLKKMSKDGELIYLLKRYRAKLNINFELNRENILHNFKKNSLGRKKEYKKYLNGVMGVPEAPRKIEKLCLKWLRLTLSEFNLVADKIKKKYNLSDVGEIDKFLLEKSGKNLLKTADEWRKKLRLPIEKNLLEISKRHKVKYIITPDYLESKLPIAAASAMNYLSGDFENILFLTKKAKINDYFLVDILVHEEFGHNVNFSNSLDSNILDRLIFLPTMYPTAEIIATYLEYRFFELSKKLNLGRKFDLFYSYVVFKRFLIVYLRAIADIRINTGKNSFAEFLEWANNETGINKDSLFHDIFGKFFIPGYATAYPLGMHALENLRKKSNINEKEFNTKVWSLGLPPFSVFLDSAKKIGKEFKK